MLVVVVFVLVLVFVLVWEAPLLEVAVFSMHWLGVLRKVSYLLYTVSYISAHNIVCHISLLNLY